ncbi:MAG: glycosyltransferase family 2 protein [Gammaproteobacteria bacterium]|nr:glycosyltransferase family 2 protein [Gammaproteobacteria bacterium]
MKAKIPVSVYIITLNEEANIGRALDCLGDFDEVVIVDSGSSDRTVEIAESRGNTRVSFREFDGFAAQKSHALSLCRNDWALNLDADEELTEEYIAEVRKIVAQDEFDALESTRTLIRWGARPRHFGGAERLIRLFRKSAGHYPPRRVHESIHIDGRVAKTSATILHHENLTFSQRVAKSKRYAEARARDKFDRGDKAPLPVLLLIFPLSFIQHYVFKGHILDGVDGLLTSMNSAYYAFMKYARLWELYRGRE